MKTSGHYWCDVCDEPAFGSLCQHCHRPAQFVSDRPSLRLPRAAAVPVTPERGHELFQQLRQTLHLL